MKPNGSTALAEAIRATSSPTRSTAAWVSTGDDTARELSARAI